jgi:hypothetical protein
MTHSAFPIATQAGDTAYRLLHKLANALRRLLRVAGTLDSFRLYL